MIFQSNSYFNERHCIGRNLCVGYFFILLLFLIILLEFVLFIYVNITNNKEKNYHPVVILPLLPNVFEKLISKELSNSK